MGDKQFVFRSGTVLDSTGLETGFAEQPRNPGVVSAFGDVDVMREIEKEFPDDKKDRAKLRRQSRKDIRL